MYNQNTAVLKSAIKSTERSGAYPVRRDSATGAPPPARGRRAHRSPTPRAPWASLALAAPRYARPTASFISLGTLRILTADHMDTCRRHGRSAVIEREYTCALRTTITTVAHSFVRVSPRIAHTWANIMVLDNNSSVVTKRSITGATRAIIKLYSFTQILINVESALNRWTLNAVH